MSYTLPDGRKATPKQERERMALLEARRTCTLCEIQNRFVITHGDYRNGYGPADLYCDTHKTR